MMVMTAKVNIKKIVIALAAVAGVILAAILLFGGGSTEPAAATVGNNDSRVEFLESFGWDVSASPTETCQIRIPEEQTEVFRRYNALQQSQGYDLSTFAGKTAMRYVYKVNNYPGATEPVYATLLVYKNQVIGGDVTDTAAKGLIQGFAKQDTTPSTIPTTTPPTEE